MDERTGEELTGDRCAKCSAPLAHDQRYCVECGTRRSALPRQISQLLASVLERGRRVASPERTEGEQLLQEDSGSTDPWAVTPRAAAAAVLGMLGFGVIVGATVGGAGAALLGPILVELHPVQSQPAALVSSPSSGVAPSTLSSTPPSAAVARTITILSTTPGAPAPSGGGGGGGGGGPKKHKKRGNTTPGPLPPIKHVFLIMLTGQSYLESFGNTASDPYLAKTLVKQGTLIPNYYGVAGSPLSNEVALVSGQGPTPQTLLDCPVYMPIKPGTSSTEGQFTGQGCTYPKSAQTLPEQFATAHLSWKAYIQEVSSSKGKSSKSNKAGDASQLESCVPKTSSPVAGDPTYATWLDPFLYFQSMTTKNSTKSGCLKDAVSLDQLKTDLKTSKTTPSLSYIVADLCDDGNPTPCAPKAPAGMTAADSFLKSVVPEIMKSPAYKADGMIAITFDNAPQSGPYADSSECCNNPTYPNLPPPPSGTGTGTGTTTTSTVTTTTSTSTTPTSSSTTTTTSAATTTFPTATTTPTGTTTTPTGTTTGTTTTPTTTPCSTGYGGTCPTGGGGDVGLLVLSRYVEKAYQDPFDYFNHFSLLASIETVFGLDKLGYASDPTLALFTSLNVFKCWPSASLCSH
jgi:hypothetical protein